MTTIYIEQSPFSIKNNMGQSEAVGSVSPGFLIKYLGTTNPEGKRIYLREYAGDNTVARPRSIRFRNGTQDNIPDQFIAVYDGPSLIMSRPLGTTTKGFRARAPDGSIWYLQVRASAPP